MKTPHLTKTEFDIFAELKAHPEGFTCQELAQRVGSNPESLKVLISNMRHKGIPIEHPRMNSPSGSRAGVPQHYTIDRTLWRDDLADVMRKAMPVAISGAELDQVADAILAADGWAV